MKVIVKEHTNILNIRLKIKVILLFLIFSRSFLDIIAEWIVFFRDSGFQFNLNGFVNILLILLFLIYIIKDKKISTLSINKYYFIFLFSSLTFIFTFQEYLISIREFIRYFSYYSLLYLVYKEFNDETDIICLVKVILFSSIIPFLIGFYQIINSNFKLDRVESSFWHPNLYGYYLSVILLLSLALIVFKQDYVRREYLYGLVIMNVIMLYLTQSRGAWISFLMACIVILFFKFREGKIFIFIAGLCFLAVLIFIFSGFFERGENLFNLRSYIEILRQEYDVEILKRYMPSTFHLRIYFWKHQILQMFVEKPLFGWGLGSFIGYSEKIFGIRLANHNGYLKILIEQGLLGLFAFFYFLKGVFNSIRRSFLSVERKFFYIITIAFTGIYVLFIIANLNDAQLDYMSVQWYFWVLLAVMLKIGNKSILYKNATQK